MQGEDIVVADIHGFNNIIELHSGIVIELNEDNVYISYNGWKGEEEYVIDLRYELNKYPDGIIKTIYKINA